MRDFVTGTVACDPAPPAVWSDQRLSMSDREEISRGLVAEESFRSIAARLGRAPSTVSREVNGNGGRDDYRAVAAANGLIRQWFPRSTNFYTLDHDEIAATQHSLNNRPRRIHGYRTSAAVFATAS